MRHLFDGMRKGVPQIEIGAHILFVGILLDKIDFHLHRAPDKQAGIRHG